MLVGIKTLLVVFIALLASTIVSGSPVKENGKPTNSDRKSSAPVVAFASPRPWRARGLRINSDEVKASSGVSKRSDSKSFGTHVCSHDEDSTPGQPELVSKFWGPLPWTVENS